MTSEKHQKSLLGGIERLIGLSPSLESLIAAGTTSKILMVLYQADIIEEDVVQQWGTHVSKKYVDKDRSKKVRKNAEAFLKVSYFLIIIKQDSIDRVVFSGLRRLRTSLTAMMSDR